MDVKPGVDGRTSDESTPNSGSKAQCAIRWMNKRGLKQRDKKWAEDTHIRMSGGGTVLGILSQRPMVKRVLNGGIDGVHLAMMFINAFPNPELTTIMIRDAFLETAERPGYTAILTRLREDVGYHEILQAIVSCWSRQFIFLCSLTSVYQPEKRVSSLRRSLYICVAKHVATNYKLNTATTPVDIATLLGGFNYIYPAENGVRVLPSHFVICLYILGQQTLWSSNLHRCDQRPILQREQISWSALSRSLCHILPGNGAALHGA